MLYTSPICPTVFLEDKCCLLTIDGFTTNALLLLSAIDIYLNNGADSV